MFVPIERTTLDDQVYGFLRSLYRLIMEEIRSAIGNGTLSRNRQTRIEGLRTKAAYWHEQAANLSLSDDHAFSITLNDTAPQELVDRFMDSNFCFLLDVPKQKRAAFVKPYIDDIGEGTEFIFGSSTTANDYLRAFHVDTNRGPACFIDAIEGGVISWNRTGDWNRMGRLAELVYLIAAVPAIMQPHEDHVIFGEDEASQIAGSLGHRKPVIFSNDQERKRVTGMPTHRLYRPDRSWRTASRKHFTPLDREEIAEFETDVLTYLESTRDLRTAGIVSGAYAQIMRYAEQNLL